MKNWNLKVKSNVQEIIKKLESTLGVDGFVFNIDNDKNDSVTFKVRKRPQWSHSLMLYNKIIVNGKILETDTENETNIEISFTRYFLTKLILFFTMVLGLGYLIGVILGIVSDTAMSIVFGIYLVIGVGLWISIQKKFKKDIQEYKILISEILES